MSRIAFVIFLMLLCVISVCYSDEFTVNSLIRGVNQARLTIQSGEVRYSLTEVNHAAQMSETEIAAWLKKKKGDELKSFSQFGPDPFYPDVGLKEFEEVYLTAQLNFWSEWRRQRTEIETCLMAFQIIGKDTLYKMAVEEQPELSLDSREAQHLKAGFFYLLTYDTQMQAKEDVGNIVVHTPAPSVRFFRENSYYGFRQFASYGRDAVPATAKRVGKETVDGVVCHLLTYETKNGRHIKSWVDVEKDFCIRRLEMRKTQDGPVLYLAEYKDFSRFGEIWYPVIIQITVSKDDSTLKRVTIIEVEAAEFNVDFPKHFFKVDPEFYGSAHDISTLEFGGLPTTSPIETEDPLLLCGPQSLLRICEILNAQTNLRELKKLSGFDPNRGTTMFGLKEAATYKGLTPKGVKSNLKALKKNRVPMPAIAYVDGNHFLVVESVQRDGVRIFDPADKYNPHLPWRELSEIWEGELLIFDVQGQPSTSEPVPLAFAPEAEYNFGEVLGGSEIRHTFTIQNIGLKPLKILSVTETCACTATVVSQREIAAGANAMIETVLKVPSENAPVEESISVFTNDPMQNTVKLTLSGQAFIPLKTFPERLTFGNQESFHSPLTKKISLHVQNEVQILGVRTDSEHLRAKLDESQIPHVEVQLLPTIPIGPFSRHLLVDYQYEGRKTTHNVPVFGEVLGAFRVTPKRFFFGLIKDPEVISKTIAISSLNNQPFHLTSVESDAKAVNVTVEKTADETRYHLTVTIHPEAPSGELSGEILLKTSSSIQPTLRVPFFGIIPE